MSKRNSIIVYTDGACSGNPGPGGWASVVITPDDHVTELVGYDPQTTNNRMEMLAAVKAIELVRDQSGIIEIFTDSVYVIRGITQWVFGWKKRDWKTADGQAVQNVDIWEKLVALSGQRVEKIKWHYCRGHQGTPGNERCDELSVQASKGQSPQAYRGPLGAYSFDVIPAPEPQPLPEMKSSTEKTKAFSYLSLLGGTVLRHKDWSSCEKRVKGQSGAKFKKATSKENEKEILKSWGFDSARAIIKDDDRK